MLRKTNPSRIKASVQKFCNVKAETVLPVRNFCILVLFGEIIKECGLEKLEVGEEPLL